MNNLLKMNWTFFTGYWFGFVIGGAVVGMMIWARC